MFLDRFHHLDVHSWFWAGAFPADETSCEKKKVGDRVLPFELTESEAYMGLLRVERKPDFKDDQKNADPRCIAKLLRN